MRNLPPGTNSDVATLKMLSAIDEDKRIVARLCTQRCVALWLDAAQVCKLTYACTYKTNTQLPCQSPHDLGVAWRQCASPENCKRMAFIFNYYGTELYRRAWGTTHQEVTTSHITETMNIVMDVGPADMLGGQRNCLQQQYSTSANTRKNNIWRSGAGQHGVRVNIEQGTTRTKPNYKRPKETFFISRHDPLMPRETRETVEEKVSNQCRRWVACVNACVPLTLQNLQQ